MGPKLRIALWLFALAARIILNLVAHLATYVRAPLFAGQNDTPHWRVTRSPCMQVHLLQLTTQYANVLLGHTCKTSAQGHPAMVPICLPGIPLWATCYCHPY